MFPIVSDREADLILSSLEHGFRMPWTMERRPHMISALGTLAKIWAHPKCSQKYRKRIERLVDVAYRRAFS